MKETKLKLTTEQLAAYGSDDILATGTRGATAQAQ
jgi:hypothetical protein